MSISFSYSASFLIRTVSWGMSSSVTGHILHSCFPKSISL
jgi:hypothetical protein